MTRWFPLLLSACWSAPPPVATRLPAPPAPVVDVRIPDECTYDKKDQAAPTKLAAGGTIALITCSLGQHPYDEEEGEDSPMVEDFAAYLVRRGHAPFAEQIGKWDQGWEWTGSWDFEGVLEAKAGGAPLVLASKHVNHPDDSTTTVYAYRIDPTGPVQLAAFSSHAVRVVLRERGDTAVIERCPPREENDDFDADCFLKAESTTLTWDGAKLVERRAP